MGVVRWTVLLVCAVVLAGCSGRAAESSERPEPARAAPAGVVAPTATPTPAEPRSLPSLGPTVVLQGARFSPATLFVEVNETVTWWNNDGVAHELLFRDGSMHARLTSVGGAKNVLTRTFDANGTFSYRCPIHENMTAAIVVGTGVDDPTG